MAQTWDVIVLVFKWQILGVLRMNSEGNGKWRSELISFGEK